MSQRTMPALVVVAFVVANCSSTDEHPPGASNDCTHNCDPIGTAPGGKQKDAGTTTGTGGASSKDASVTIKPICVSDPTFGVVLCDRSDFCPGVVVDQTSLQGCGFVQLSSGSPSVECICNGRFLCPVTTVPNCGSLSGLLSQQSSFSICNQVGTGKCLDLSSIPVSRD